MQELLRGILRDHSRVIFNGNGYSPEWAEEAARRGLPNLVSTPDALAPLLSAANQALVEKYGVFSAAEMASRHEIASVLAEIMRGNLMQTAVARVRKIG